MDDIMLTDEELRLRRRRRKRLLILAASAAVLILAVVFLGRPTLHFIKAWQARRQAREAMELIEKEQWNDARKKATAAYQLWPNEPEAIRAVARFLSRTRQAQALEFWDRLGDNLTRADLVDEASVALLAGDDTRAKRAIDALLTGKFEGTKPIDRLLAAQLALRHGAPIEAHESLQKVFNDPAATNREKLQAALIEIAISGGSEAWREEGWSWMKRVGEQTDAASLDALTVLAQTLVNQEKAPDKFPLTGPELSDKLERHPLARAPQKLLAIDLKIREQKEAKADLIAQAVERWKNAAPEEMAALATWLNGKTEFQRVLDAIPLDKSMLSRDLFLQRLDALGGLGDWREIKNLLDRDTFPLDPVVQKMYLARCNAQLNEKAASENNWQRALESAHGDPQKLLMLAGYAEKNGASEIARAAYDEAAAEAPRLRAAHQGRLRLAETTRDTKKIHGVLAEMLVNWPNDPAVQNDEAYMRLLLLGGTAAVPSSSDAVPSSSDASSSSPAPDASPAGNEEIEKIEQLARTLVEKEPASLPHRTLLALARLKLGKYSDAMDTYSNIQVARNALTHSVLAIHAAVLAANGKSEDAATELREVDVTRLLPEEAALIAGIPK
jgi:tetratricopeptide (TPR) repeat protein